MCFWCHKLGYNPYASLHTSKDCLDPMNIHSNIHKKIYRKYYN